MRRGKYRWLTALREHWTLGVLFGHLPKPKNCGWHELQTMESSPGGAAKLKVCRHCQYEEMGIASVQEARRHHRASGRL